MNEPEKIDPRELSPLALAFVGDSVLELLVRQRLVEHHRLSAGKLNAEKVKYVSARAQFREEQLLEPLFTEDELAVFKRGRNASKASVAKHASPEEYRASTGFECLLGWLYLNGRLSRVHELFETCKESSGLFVVPPDGPFRRGGAQRRGSAAVAGGVASRVLAALVVGTLGVLVGVLVLVGGRVLAGIGGAVGALIAGAVLSLVLAVGAAFLTAIFHRIVAPFDFGRRSALPAHSLTGCGGFMHRSSKEVS